MMTGDCIIVRTVKDCDCNCFVYLMTVIMSSVVTYLERRDSLSSVSASW